MKLDNYQNNLFDEIIVDNFAGGGGASTGIELASGRPVAIAINHDPAAILLHKTNHPHTIHLQASVWDVDPVKVCGGRPVGLAWFSPDCFEAGTLVLTSEGYKPIENVREGDLVLTHKKRWKPVTATMQTERDEMVVSGYGHYGIVCSTGHPFYVKTRTEVWNNEKRSYDHSFTEPLWKKAKELTNQDYWGTPTSVEPLDIPPMEKPNNKSVTLPIDRRLLWLAGWYVGDGWTRLTSTRGELVITCGEQDIDFLDSTLDLWPRSGKRCKDGELAWSFRKVRTGGQFACNCRGLVIWLRENFGHLAESKKVPAWLLGASEELKKAFLAGYVGADGYCVGNLTEITTVSKELAFGIRSLVATMGYSPMIYKKAQGGNAIEGREINTKPLYAVKWRTETDEAHLQTYNSDGILWAPIRKSENTGNRKIFYNISVLDDESYIAEGLIVHNCKHFSKAKGAALVDRKIRGLAWIVLRWAAKVRPRVIMLENVEEFQTWGPVRKGKPVRKKAGQTFHKFLSQLRDLGYEVDYRELMAADYGAPTSRKRFVLCARCDGKPIVWPEPTHAPRDSEEVKSGKLKPWRSAAEIIDWSVPGYSIFDSKAEIKQKYGVNAVRPLADNTLRRIIRGVDKFTLKSGKPFIVDCNHGGAGHIFSQDEPVTTITGRAGIGLTAASLIQYHTEQTESARVSGLNAPINTVDASNRYGLACANLVEYYGNGVPLDIKAPMHTATSHDREGLVMAHVTKYFDGGYKGCGDAADAPLSTITALPRHGVCAAHVAEFKGQDVGQGMERPLRTITTSAGEFGIVRTMLAKAEGDLHYWPQIRELLNKFCGYELREDEVLLLIIGGAAYYIADITLRMLTPRELYNAMGFPPDYIIDRDYAGNPYPKTQQVARCGNAVCPPIAAAMVRANLPEWCTRSIETMEELGNVVSI